MVRVANGSLIPCTQQLQDGHWFCDTYEFVNTFKVFPLGSYEGILGLDWLAAHSPMQVDWSEHWLSFELNGAPVTLLGQDAAPQICSLIEVSYMMVSNTVTQPKIPSEIKELLSRFAPVFEAPKGLPPRRKYDHTIPLIPGAQPVSIRPYRIAPALKDEMEKQVKDMLDAGIIRHNNSAFSSQ